MSVLAPIKQRNQSKVHYSEYIRTENKPDEESEEKPVEPGTSTGTEESK